MARITIEDCTRQIENRFGLVLMAAIRAKQLMRGARPLVKAEENRAVVVALREIAAGGVHPDLPDADGEGKQRLTGPPA
jgi:DNA-directed RNA polymerase subunit omega